MMQPFAAGRSIAPAVVFPLAVLLTGAHLPAQETPVSILAARIGGHVHPSLCRTKDGTLAVVYKGDNVLMCARSTDSGQTWSRPEAIATTARRPDVIREVKAFEVYPGTADTLPDDRVLVTWNYIADDKARDGYYERALLYTISSDQGRTWSEQELIGPIDSKHLGAVRHTVLPWSDGRWLLPLRVGPPRLFDPRTGKLTEFSVSGPDGKQHEFQQIVRTAKNTLLAMGPVLLHSPDEGRSWTSIDGFPAIPDRRDNAEGRYLTPLSDGRVLVTWGIGSDNKGLRYNLSSDDGRSWNTERTVVLLPETNIAARYYSARTVQLDNRHVGTVFMNRDGVHFLRVSLERLGAPSKARPLDPVGELAAPLEPTRRVAYKKAGGRELELHVFEPDGWKSGDRRACFVIFHGGGWSGGEPRRMYPFAEYFARQGIVGISVQYRLLNARQGTTVFDCVRDGRSAVRYLRSHADSLGIDPEKIIVSGGSAGGHVAAGTALFEGVDEDGESTGVSSVPNALVLLYPVIDTSKAGYGNAKIGDRWQELSPVHQVKGKVPPTLIFHGTGDTVTPFAGAEAFREAMQRAGNCCELVAHPDGKHGYLMFERQLYLATLAKTETFLISLGLLSKLTP
jgi:acetyl esterase/lipase